MRRLPQAAAFLCLLLVPFSFSLAATPSPTVTPSPSASPTPAPTVTRTPTPSPSASPSASPSPTPCDTDECNNNEASRDVEAMENGSDFSIYGDLIGRLFSDVANSLPAPDCTMVRALEQSLTRTMAEAYCPARCERDYPNRPALKTICKSLCRRSIACYYTLTIASPMSAQLQECLGHSQADYDSCVQHYRVIEERARRASGY